MATVLVLLTGLLGCELSPPLQPLGSTATPRPTSSATPVVPTPSPAPTPTPSPTPAIKALRGYVVDRSGNRLPGAKVALGAFSVLSAEASASATDEMGQAVTLAAGEFILLNVPSGEQTLTLSYDDATHSLPVNVQPSGVTHVDPITLLVDGAVPTGSKAVLASADLPLLKVQKASSSAPLAFMQETVTVDFKAPPNGVGDQIGAYAFTYVQGEASMSETVTWPVSKINVPAALGKTRSGPIISGAFHILNTSAALQSAWTFTKPDATLKIQFFNAEGGRPIQDRDGNPLVIRIPCLLVY